MRYIDIDVAVIMNIIGVILRMVDSRFYLVLVRCNDQSKRTSPDLFCVAKHLSVPRKEVLVELSFFAGRKKNLLSSIIIGSINSID